MDHLFSKVTWEVLTLATLVRSSRAKAGFKERSTEVKTKNCWFFFM